MEPEDVDGAADAEVGAEGEDQRGPTAEGPPPRALPWLRRGLLRASVLQIEVLEPEKVDLEGGMRLRVALREPGLDSRWVKDPGSQLPLDLPGAGVHLLLSQAKSKEPAMEPIQDILSCACVGSPLLVVTLLADVDEEEVVEEGKEEGDGGRKGGSGGGGGGQRKGGGSKGQGETEADVEEEEEGSKPRAEREVCRGEASTSHLSDPFQLAEQARLAVAPLAYELAAKEAEEGGGAKERKEEIAQIQAHIEEAESIAIPQSWQEWVPMLEPGSGTEVCRFLISATLSLDEPPFEPPSEVARNAPDS
jgi:hypothetical protein